MINFLLNFAVLRYYFTALKPGDSFGGDGVFFMVMLSGVKHLKDSSLTLRMTIKKTLRMTEKESSE